VHSVATFLVYDFQTAYNPLPFICSGRSFYYMEVQLEEEDDHVRPFEFLTSAESLHPFLEKALHDDSQVDPSSKRVLHVGCGNSTVGEYLIRTFRVQSVLNIDRDKELLDQLKRRWQRQCAFSDPCPRPPCGDTMAFQCVDFCIEQVDAEDGGFDLVVDKSTLDCTLCSDRSSAALLVEMYRLLGPNGVYLVVSFHSKELMLPLLRDLPGADWRVDHFVMLRQMEDLNLTPQNIRTDHVYQPMDTILQSTEETCQPSPVWSTGTFKPDEQYRKALNVFLCRKQSSNQLALPSSRLDPEAIYEHVYRITDAWYQIHDPILTPRRRSQIEQDFAGRQHVPLSEAYRILFTPEEREQLDYEFFLEDWGAFHQSHPDLPNDTLSLLTAFEFIEEMQ
jgi:SAM-dependent methyltransferase